VWVHISSTNTSRPGSMLPTSMRQSTLRNSSLSAALLDLFSAPAEASYRSADRRFAHLHPRYCKQELGPLGVGSPRPLFRVLGEKLRSLVAQLRSLARSLPLGSRVQRSSSWLQ